VEESVHVDGALNVVVKGPRTVMVAPALSSGLGVLQDERLHQDVEERKGKEGLRA
jgi:hypothetical protein